MLPNQAFLGEVEHRHLFADDTQRYIFISVIRAVEFTES